MRFALYDPEPLGPGMDCCGVAIQSPHKAHVLKVWFPAGGTVES